MAEEITTTQQLANAADAFVRALGALFPGDLFDQFFHENTVRRAYWAALQHALANYTTPENAMLTRGLMSGDVLAEPRVLDELLKLFLPGQTPDFALVAGQWSAALTLPFDMRDELVSEAQVLFNLIADELRRSPDVRHALQQLAQARYMPLGGFEDADSTAEQDLNRLLEVALMAGPGSLNLQVRHLLALAHFRDPSPSIAPDRALVALARLAASLDRDALQTVWDQVETVGDPALRLRLLGQIAPHLARHELTPDPLALIEKAMGDAPPDPVTRAETLLALAPHLAPPPRDRALPPFQNRALEGAQGIEDPASRVRALGALIASLPPDLQSEAVSQAFEAAACCIKNEVARATALSVLPPGLPPEFHTRLLSIAYELEEPEARALLMGQMIPHLAPDLQSQALIGALNAIEQINGDDARTAALITLAPYVDSMGPLKYIPEGLRQTIWVTFSIERADDRARAFAALAPYLSEELLTEALHALKSIEDDEERARALTKLAPHLPGDLQVAAFAIAREIGPSEARAEVLATIAPYLSATARAQALADALAAALSIERRYDRVVALVDLAPHLPDDLQWRALQEALKAVRSIPDESERARALVFLAPHLIPDQMADALADAYTILDPLERVPALSALMPHLPDEPCLRVGQDAINLARAVKAAHHKASILAAIAPVMPLELLDSAVEVVSFIKTPYDQMHVLTALLPRQPDRLRGAALEAARAVPNRTQRVNALLEVVQHAPPAQRYAILDEALDDALGIPDDYDRAGALAQFAPYLDAQIDTQRQQQDALSLALDACLEIDGPEMRAALLGRLAAVWADLLTSAQSYSLWRRVVGFLREQPFADALSDLAALTPVIHRMGMASASEDVADTLLDMVFG